MSTTASLMTRIDESCRRSEARLSSEIPSVHSTPHPSSSTYTQYPVSRTITIRTVCSLGPSAVDVQEVTANCNPRRDRQCLIAASLPSAPDQSALSANGGALSRLLRLALTTTPKATPLPVKHPLPSHPLVSIPSKPVDSLTQRLARKPPSATSLSSAMTEAAAVGE